MARMSAARAGPAAAASATAPAARPIPSHTRFPTATMVRQSKKEATVGLRCA
jgi:hypothetical protein